jgi:hypothetical protein
MRYYSFQVNKSGAAVSAVIGNFQQTITVQNTSFFHIYRLTVSASVRYTSTAKGVFTVTTGCVALVFQNTITSPIATVANLADVLGVSSLNGIIIPFSDVVPFEGDVTIPAIQTLNVLGTIGQSAAIIGAQTAADITLIEMTANILIGWDDDRPRR